MTMDELDRRSEGRIIFLNPIGRLPLSQATWQIAGENHGMPANALILQSITPQVLGGMQRARSVLGDVNSGNRIRLYNK